MAIAGGSLCWTTAFSNTTMAIWHPDRSLTLLEEAVTINRFTARALGLEDGRAESNERVGCIVVRRPSARAVAAAEFHQPVVDVEADSGGHAGRDAEADG